MARIPSHFLGTESIASERLRGAIDVRGMKVLSVYSRCLNKDVVAADAEQLTRHNAQVDGGTAIGIHRTPRARGVKGIAFRFQNYGNTGEGEFVTAPLTVVGCTFEYPRGTFHTVLSNGRSSGTLGYGADILTDTYMIDIPADTYLWSRTFVTVSLEHGASPGIPVGIGGIQTYPPDEDYLGVNNYLGRGGDGSNQLRTVGNKWSTDGYYNYGPVMMYGIPDGPLTNVEVCGVGDSWIAGQADNVGYVARACEAAGLPYTTVAQGGESAQTFATAALRVNRENVFRTATSIVFSYGQNDTGTFEEVLQKVHQALAAAGRYGARIWIPTWHPRTTSVDKFSSAHGQTPVTTTYPVVRKQMNDYLRSSQLRTDCQTLGVALGGIIEVAGAVETDALNTPPEPGRINAKADRWYVPNGVAPTSDGFHPTSETHVSVLTPLVPVASFV